MTPGISKNKNDYIHLYDYRQAIAFIKKEKMSDWYEKYYWRAGFKTRLYDWLTPESYFDSMRQTIEMIPDKIAPKIWDVGCGSGLLLRFLNESLNRNIVYCGSDLLFAGLEKAKMRARELKVSAQAEIGRAHV